MSRLLADLIRWLVNDRQMRPHHCGPCEIIETSKGGFDCVIDVTGVASAIEGAFAAAKRGGKLLVFGVAPSGARISLSPVGVILTKKYGVPYNY